MAGKCSSKSTPSSSKQKPQIKQMPGNRFASSKATTKPPSKIKKA